MRKVARVIISAEGRDKNKVFVLNEMPASQTEKWAMRLLLAMAKAGVQVPDGSAGMEAVAGLGFASISKLDFGTAESLMDEMMQCVTIQPDPKNPQLVRPLVEEDIQEVATRLKLRMEVFTLHSGFTIPGYPSTLIMEQPGPISTPIVTSPQQLRRS